FLAFRCLRYDDDVFIVGVHDVPIQSMHLIRAGGCCSVKLAAKVIALQQRWLPRLEIVQKVLALITPFHRALETLMLVLAVLLGA
ncbi:hypothetical protein MJL81_32095, partial [Salmonella enterica subsp. enterica serovar Anatum]|nr:hypothetical protein [Salmonella enterica subsp. enterica serovar Anatum]